MLDKSNSYANDHSHASTGIAGLDDVLEGGFPRNHLYLIEGDPGTGKTTLALQFVLEGERRGEKGLYVTLSESSRELIEVGKSHGWEIDALPILEMTPTEDELKPEAQYTVFHPSEVELTDTTASVLKKVNAINPARVVFDSLSELRLLARDPLRYRRQILALKRYFFGRQCTVLLLDDRTAGHKDLQLQSIAHGVISMERLERDYGTNRRRLEVRKLRGSRFREGFHDFTIETGGVVLHPRLIAGEHHPTFKREALSSGIKELDTLMGGGIDTGTTTLLMGPAGSGKSTIASRYAASCAELGELACIFTLDETLAMLIERAEAFGMRFNEFIGSRKIAVHQIDPAELSPGAFVARIRRLVECDKAKVVVIDSLNGLLTSMASERSIMMQLHELLSFLNQHGVITLLVMAQHGFVGSGLSVTQDVSYLADSVILFRYFESSGQVRQALSVVKKRSGSHERTIRELSFRKSRIEVGQPLVGFEGVLSGVPTFHGKDKDLA